MKKKTFYVSVNCFYEVNLIIWMDAKSFYLTYRILIYGLNKKLNLEKIKSWGRK